MIKKKIITKTESVCPVCLGVIRASYVEGEDGNVYMEKECAEHGFFKTLVWEGEAQDFLDWGGHERLPDRPLKALDKKRGCPLDCGLCEEHENNACCVLLELTDRCNLKCPVCFAGAGKDSGDEPSLKEIAAWYDMLLEHGGPFNIQLSGGEPTLREDLSEIIALGRERGFKFFQLNTNGLRIADEEGYAAALKHAGVSCVYLQFDGMKDDIYISLRGRKLLRKKYLAIHNLAKAGLPVVLVPTLVKGINDSGLGKIIDFARNNIPHIRGVHIQPASSFGRYEIESTDETGRLTIPAVLGLMEKQTDGIIQREHFSGGGAESPYCSFHASYRRQPDGSIKPLAQSSAGCCTSSRAMEYVADRWGNASGVYDAAANMSEKNVSCCCNAKPDIVTDSQREDACCGFDEFLQAARENTFTLSGMVFQDAYNIDLKRLRRCYICEVDRAGKMIPFCAYNLTDAVGNYLYRGKAD